MDNYMVQKNNNTNTNKQPAPHSLFISTTEDGNKHHRLFLDDFIMEGNQVHEMLNILHDSDEEDTLEVRINSRGGYIKYGQQFINTIKDRFTGRVVTILESEAYSMAALAFMTGDRRIIYPHSTFMVHDISMYLGGKASESKMQMDIYTKSFQSYFESLFAGVMTKTEMNDLYLGKDFWFDAKEMCHRGIATDVLVNGTNYTADKYLEDGTKRPKSNPEVEVENQLKELKRLKTQEKALQGLVEDTIKDLEEQNKKIKLTKKRLDIYCED